MFINFLGFLLLYSSLPSGLSLNHTFSWSSGDIPETVLCDGCGNFLGIKSLSFSVNINGTPSTMFFLFFLLPENSRPKDFFSSSSYIGETHPLLLVFGPKGSLNSRSISGDSTCLSGTSLSFRRLLNDGSSDGGSLRRLLNDGSFCSAIALFNP